MLSAKANEEYLVNKVRRACKRTLRRSLLVNGHYLKKNIYIRISYKKIKLNKALRIFVDGIQLEEVH